MNTFHCQRQRFRLNVAFRSTCSKEVCYIFKSSLRILTPVNHGSESNGFAFKLFNLFTVVGEDVVHHLVVTYSGTQVMLISDIESVLHEDGIKGIVVYFNTPISLDGMVNLLKRVLSAR